MEITAYLVGVGIQLLILGRFAHRFGFSPVWGMVALIPAGAIILAWVIAFMPWSFPDARELAQQDSDDLAETFE